jgi:hypothetical protein
LSSRQKIEYGGKGERELALLFLRKGEEDAEVAEVIASGTGHESVVEIVKERVGITPMTEIERREVEGAGARKSGAVGDGSGGRRVAVDTIGAGA